MKAPEEGAEGPRVLRADSSHTCSFLLPGGFMLHHTGFFYALLSPVPSSSISCTGILSVQPAKDENSTACSLFISPRREV